MTFPLKCQPEKGVFLPWRSIVFVLKVHSFSGLIMHKFAACPTAKNKGTQDLIMVSVKLGEVQHLLMLFNKLSLSVALSGYENPCALSKFSARPSTHKYEVITR